jgi:hypothetical protein
MARATIKRQGSRRAAAPSIVAVAALLLPASAGASLAARAERVDRDYETRLLGPVQVTCWAESPTVASCRGESRMRRPSEPPTYVWRDHVVKIGHRLVVKAGILEEH